MELLTGKAKESFLNYVQQESKYCSYLLNEVKYENSERGEFLWYGNETDLLKEEKFLIVLIIDFFDSVGIYVEIKNDVFVVNNILECDFYYKINKSEYHNSNSRQEATIAGIKKANEIFNYKF